MDSTFDLDKGRLPLISLNGLWRFHAGDDPAFAEPAFDDSAWLLVPADQTGRQNESLPHGLARFWYRTRIFVPAGTPPLSIYVPHVDMNFEIFVDGQRIDGLPPYSTSTHVASRVFNFPVAAAEASSHPRILSVAFRCWRFVQSSSDDSALGGRIRLGATPLVQEAFLLRTRNAFWYLASDLFLAMLNTLAGLTAMGLFLFRRQEKEYLWYSLLTLIFAATHSHMIWTTTNTFGWPQLLLTANVLWQASCLALMVFLYRLLGGKRDRFFWIAISSILVGMLMAFADFVPYMFREEWLWADIRLYNGLSFLLFLPFAAWVIVFVARKAIQGVTDARLLLPAVVMVALDNALNYGFTAAQTIFQQGGSSWWDWFFYTSDWPMPFTVQQLGELFLLLTMLAVLIRRFTRTRLHEETYEREREAARSVQQVLVPDAIPVIPGFRIASVYKPFGEVGGDFFQVIPIETGEHGGSVLVVIGDVSGKGLPAAMTVSLLVGTVRTLAHYTQSPAQILTAMNQRLIGRSNGGFTTCLVLRAAPDGTVTIANAGHISPYVDGGELELENGFPMGLSPDATYAESTFHLAVNDQLTLVTDGVVEARSKGGELFGFARTHSVSRGSPESIATAAQHFGQDDDITVLSICRAY
ncbi:SpoIIE family protein phosphatase [Terracidiphilus gabretensis]|uniref:SpoIIE family protein phosphatase n=1 Tax=Terracidiphilus gabretensis TaxID=1577687 RepID=UPI00071B57FB|nr:SpoIIE family protein phosphatase [Terracidiphilus gabretensis]